MGLTRQRACQAEKLYGTPHVDDRVKISRTTIRGDKALLRRIQKASRTMPLSQAWREAGLSEHAFRILEARTGVRLPRYRAQTKVTREALLSAIRRTPTLANASRMLGYKHPTYIYRRIVKLGCRAEVDVIVAERLKSTQAAIDQEPDILISVAEAA